jgi:hypothetical protein
MKEMRLYSEPRWKGGGSDPIPGWAAVLLYDTGLHAGVCVGCSEGDSTFTATGN